MRIVLDADPAMELKPSMRCRAEIQLGTVVGAISVPIQSIFREGPLAFVYVPGDGGWAQRQVILGRASELAVEVVKGVEVGDVVLLREPDMIEIVSRISAERLDAGPSMPGGSGSGHPGASGRPEQSTGDAQHSGQKYQGAHGQDSAPKKSDEDASASSGKTAGEEGEKTASAEDPSPEAPAAEETP